MKPMMRCQFDIPRDTARQLADFSREHGLRVRYTYRQALEMGLPELWKKYSQKGGSEVPKEK